MTVRIFISYSQEDFKPEARFMCNYLSKHVHNSDVFIDQLKPKGIMDEEIKSNTMLCQECIDKMTTESIEKQNLPQEVHLICKYCVLDKLKKNQKQPPYG